MAGKGEEESWEEVVRVMGKAGTVEAAVGAETVAGTWRPEEGSEGAVANSEAEEVEASL